MAAPTDIPSDKEVFRAEFLKEDNDPIRTMERVYHIWRNWADFHLIVTSPTISSITPPILHEPDFIAGTDEKEFVYPIWDYGHQLSTSKGEELFSAGMSMCKLFFTIEKMIALFVERLASGGTSKDVEVQVAFAGHEIAQRKAFESIINLTYNVVVTNFDPGAWGERYLATVKRLADRGYGYPEEAPRLKYKQSRSGGRAVGIKRS
jgi:hypothetical protein